MTTFFDPHQRATIDAAMARIIPTTDTPGAAEAGTIDFLDRYLSGIDCIYAKPDGSGFETLSGRRARAWQRRIDILRTTVRRRHCGPRSAQPGYAWPAVHRAGCRPAGRRPRGRRTPRRGGSDERLASRHGVRARGAGAATGQCRNLAELLRAAGPCTRARASTLTRSTAATATRSAGRPSASPARAHLPRCTPAATPSSSTSPTAPTSRKWRSAMPAPKPERTDVCIIGAGASGAAAAKVLTERGFRVVALERGPWRTKETFGGDELANVNRYNLWPDPAAEPAHRTGSPPTRRPQSTCSARSRRWSAAARCTGRAGCRGSPRRISGCARSPATCQAPRWPTGRSATTTWSRTTPRWSGRSACPAWPARTPTRGRAAQGYPCPPMPLSRYAREVPQGLRERWAGTPSRPRRPRCPARSTAARRR